MNFATSAIAVSLRLVEHYAHAISIASKNLGEASFWKKEIGHYSRWYNGEYALHGVPPPASKNRVRLSIDDRKNACFTWNTMFQQRKYLSDLDLRSGAFSGKIVCDIGSGPHANALCFSSCEIYGVDHLLDRYKYYGFPIEEYDSRYHFVGSKSESTPFPDGFFDAMISVNAIDHVDDIESTSREMRRILKTGGLLRVAAHYHRPTLTEPISLSDARFRHLFGWATGLRKIAVSRTDYRWLDGLERKPDWNPSELNISHDFDDDVFVVWGNF